MTILVLDAYSGRFRLGGELVTLLYSKMVLYVQDL